MDRLSAISDVRNYVSGLIDNTRNIVDECKARHEDCGDEQEYLGGLIDIEDILWHMI